MNDTIPANYLANLRRELETLYPASYVEQWLHAPNQHLNWWEPISLCRCAEGREKLDRLVQLLVAGMPV